MRRPTRLYDLALRKWYYLHDLKSGDRVYSDLDLTELRLDRYLITYDQTQEYADGTWVLVHEYEILGKIVEVFTPRDGIHIGYWTVEKDGIVDIFQGSTSYKPVRLES